MGTKIFCGIRDQNFHLIWDQGSKFWVKKMGSVMKNIPRYDPVITDIRDFTTLLTLFCVILRRETSNVISV